jgi:2-succinyl-6-hydroxy-2,4-cyclohexadiene-1-carboxylate synthase
MSNSAAQEIDLDVGGDLLLHVSREGSGQPLVLLHGFTGSSQVWRPLIAGLGDGFATIAVDMPGHGNSAAPRDPDRYALDRFAGDLRQVLDNLDIERAAVLGYSMGGRAALRFALAHPDRVSALLLESTSPGITDPAARAERKDADEVLARMIERDGVEAFVNKWERLPLWRSQQSLPEESRARLRELRLSNSAHGLANSLRGAGAGSDPAVLDRLGELQPPTLLVAGELDEKYVAAAQLMVEKIARSRVEIIAQAGHTVHLDQPSAFAGAVAEFLKGLPSADKPRR